MNKKFTRSIIILVVLIISLPFFYAQISGGTDYIFSGFLFNPLDGNSYLAKMQEGWSGSWQFTLPYTVEPGEGTYLFLFYLFLGHLARFLHIPVLLTFHITRILATICLFLVLRIFLTRYMKMDSRSCQRAFLLFAFGSGLGWLAYPLGGFTSDFWVAESYPFLSSYANPHFPLGLALILGVIILTNEKKTPLRNASIFILSLFLGVVLPFGIVVSGMVVFGISIWGWIKERASDVLGLVSFILGGFPCLLYQFWTSQTHPILQIWNAQNLTPSPPIWDFILSFSPIIILAFWGLPIAWQARQETRIRALLVWLFLGVILVYFPFSLQRRFMLGYFIPIACLGVIGLQRITQNNKKNWIWPLVFSLSLITNIILIMAGIFGLQAHSPVIYLQRNEQQALRWVSANTTIDSIILASPEMGLFIPAQTGRKVLYGHPFETVNAEKEKREVLSFYRGEFSVQNQASYLADNHIGYVFWGAREKTYGKPEILNNLSIAVQFDDLFIYEVESPK